MSNNKQNMKLYTENDLIDLVQSLKDYTHESRSILGHDERDAKEFVHIFLKNRFPIELPSDEEIKQQSHIQYPVNLQPNGRTMGGGKYDIDINYSERNAFIECAKWMRDKILQGGNK